MLFKIFLSCVLFFISQISVAGVMVVYPLTHAEPESNAGAFQTHALHSIPSVQPNPWIIFLNKLQTCTPGKFVLPQVDINLLYQYGDLAIYNVSGMKENKCEIAITLKTSQYATASSNPLQLSCALSAEAIQLLTKRYTNLASKLPGSYQTSEEAYYNKMSEECKK